MHRKQIFHVLLLNAYSLYVDFSKINLVAGFAGSDLPAGDVDGTRSNAGVVNTYFDKKRHTYGFEIRGYKIPPFRMDWMVAAGYVKNHAIPEFVSKLVSGYDEHSDDSSSDDTGDFHEEYDVDNREDSDSDSDSDRDDDSDGGL